MKFYSTQLSKLLSLRFPHKKLQPKDSTIEFLMEFARTYNPQTESENGVVCKGSKTVS